MQQWAKSRGITGVVLQEGVSARLRSLPQAGDPLRRLGSRLLRRFGPEMLRLRENYFYARHAAVWGEATKRRLVASGRQADSVHVTGNPGYDPMPGRAVLATAERRTVLFGHQTQPNKDVELAACRLIIQVCTEKLRCRLLFRPHPRGHLREAELREMVAASRHPELVEIVSQGALTDYLPRASVFLTFYSTAAYEAAIQGVPIVLANWVSPMFELDAPEYGAALSATRPEELEGMLRQALDDERCRASLDAGADKWLRDHLGVLDGGAAGRVAALLGQLVQGEKTGPT
jgi:hypothetical protein